MHVRARQDVPALPHLARQYWSLTKPRVTQLALFCAVIGMFLAVPDLPRWQTVLLATAGIWLLAGAAFAVNSMIERHIDARMARTRMRPLAQGELTPLQALVFSGLIGGAGMWVLYVHVNPLTMWLTFATFVGYAIVYTVLLKPHTPQNIVIGGMSGAMPPVLGWAAVTNTAPAEAWLLALIIFVWTPPHFWALALYRREDYRNAGLPMLPNTHGPELTRLHILLYTIVLVATTTLPYADPDVRPRLPRRGPGARRRLPRLRVVAVSALQRRPGAARRSATRSSTWRRCSRPCSLTTTCGDGRARGDPWPAGHRASRSARCCFCGACSPAGFQSVDITGANYAQGFNLVDTEGKARTIADFKGKVVVVFFGFAQCPDVCPTTLADMAEVRKRLGRDGERVQVVFITVDPARDTPQVLSAYMRNFDPSFVALTGTAPSRSRRPPRTSRCSSRRCRARPPRTYSIDHTAASYVFDREGNVRLFVRYGQPVDAVISDIKRLL